MASEVNQHTANGTKYSPLVASGLLDSRFKFEESTPSIGREYFNIDIVQDLLNAEETDELIRDLAITISQRGVVFFRQQTTLTNDLQKTLILKLGQLTGRPAENTLHINPILNNTTAFGVGDNEISTISSEQRKQLFIHHVKKKIRRYADAQWHTDIQYENCPADYTSLRITQLPSTGGDTLWASGYDLYDRFSKPYQTLFDSLTATYAGDGIALAVKEGRATLYDKPRGSPLNVGAELVAIHPVVRTNPVTGWKSIFAIGGFPTCKKVNELTGEESQELLDRFRDAILRNHDLQVRFRWRGRDDFAIWDNRSVFHSATYDYDGLGERFGNRAVGVGERPFFDPGSLSKAEALERASQRAVA